MESLRMKIHTQNQLAEVLGISMKEAYKKMDIMVKATKKPRKVK